MPDVIEISRVVVIADTALEKALLSEFLKLGAKGYNCSYCFGKGRHETIEDPYTGRSRVRVEVLCRPSVASSILDYVHRKQFGAYPVAAFLDTVEVDARDTFF
ncbi:MAG TPA: hypothetical protein VHV08_04450 [Pirellulales bacterium]|nr:hypothetical protein [Pirellulales bacterium]